MMKIESALEYVRNVVFALSGLIVFGTIAVGILLTNSEIKTMAEYAACVFFVGCLIEIIRQFVLYILKSALNKHNCS